MGKKYPDPHVIQPDYIRGCSIEVALTVIGGKWKGMILYARVIPNDSDRCVKLFRA